MAKRRMIALLIYAGDWTDSPDAATRFGGAPSVPDAGFISPVCKRCGGNMQFVAQVHPHSSCVLYLIFMCQNDPGVCNDWDANGGANAVVCVHSTTFVLADVPADGVTLRATCQAVATVGNAYARFIPSH